ncbi:hypothetical protein Tco_1261362 [Tanacetum coccineum]
MPFPLQRNIRENVNEKPGSCGIHDSLDDKIHNRQLDRNHGDQQRDPLRMPKDQISIRTYSRRERHASLNPSIQTKQRLREGKGADSRGTMGRTSLLGLLKKADIQKKVVINDDHTDQPITIRGNLSAGYRSKLIKALRKHTDTFAWTPADMTGIPRFVAEHQLKTYPHIEPRVQKNRSMALDRRKVVKAEVEEWLKSEIVKRVQYANWVANQTWPRRQTTVGGCASTLRT